MDHENWMLTSLPFLPAGCVKNLALGRKNSSGIPLAISIGMNRSFSNQGVKASTLLLISLVCLAGVNRTPAIAVTAEGSAGCQRRFETPTRRVFVRSKSLLVRGAVVEEKLLKSPEFKQLGFSITRDESDADIILELRHDLLTKYVFSVVEVKTQTVIAGGKLSSLGGTVAGKVAKRFVKEMSGINQP